MPISHAAGVSVSVVICAYTMDRWPDLERAVGSVTDQAVLPTEIILVIDHAPDLLERAQRRWSRAELVPMRVMASTGAPGLSGARNTGSFAARGDVVAFLDDDARAAHDWVSRLAGWYRDPAVLAVGGKVDPDLRGPRPRWWPPEFDWVIGCSYTGQPDEPAAVRNLIGANMSVRKAPLVEIGGFAEALGRVGTVPLGCEETDLCIRLSQQRPDGKVWYDPATRVDHSVSPGRLTWKYFRARCYAEGLSKAHVAERVGSNPALSAEQTHVRRVLLPSLRTNAVAALRADVGAAGRFAATAAGLLFAAAGYARGKDRLGETVVSLVTNTITTAALGMLFWIVAARRYDEAQVGEDAALLAAMVMLSSVAQLNLNLGLPRLLPQVVSQRWRPVAAAYFAAAGASVVVTVAFLAVAGSLGNFAFLRDEPAVAFALIPAVALWSVFALQDAVLVSTRLAPLVPLENALFGCLKVVLLFVFVGRMDGHGVFGAWLAAMLVLVGPINAVIFGSALRRPEGVRTSASEVLPLAQRRLVGRFLATDYVGALLSQGATALLPLVVVSVLGGTANAYFYTAFLIAATFTAMANAVTTALVSEGAHDESRGAALLRNAQRWYLGLAVPAVVVVGLAAPLLLRMFGPVYAEESTRLLQLLLLGTIPQAFVILRVGLERVRGDAGAVVRVEAASMFLVVAGAVVGMKIAGLTGLGVGWVLAHSALALALNVRVVRARAIAVSG